ncbi:SIR2 family protein [Xanthomonas citri pv. bilvae]|uniref:SIR2 family protein n=1 Tax=Xanthomonas citri TaxID=346 RepID=UPI000541B245|nr:conserved hypothetical protein [Xanthomonas citri pv. bilvae]
MIDWPDDLVEDLARRRSVIFLGAGVSKNSINDAGERPADWIEFLSTLAVQIVDVETKVAVERCISGGDLLTACEIAYKTLRPENFRTRLLQAFSQKRFHPARIHEELVRIDSRIVMTTNFDKIYDSLAMSMLHGDVLVKTYSDDDVAEVVRRSNRCILKIHGSIDAASSAIITRSDYARLRVKHAGFYRVIDALFATHTFLFLGASMNDPDIRLILEDYANQYEHSRPHFVVMPNGHLHARELEVLEESMNVRAIFYDPENHHQQLSDGVAARTLVEAKREELVERMDW